MCIYIYTCTFIIPSTRSTSTRKLGRVKTRGVEAACTSEREQERWYESKRESEKERVRERESTELLARSIIYTYTISAGIADVNIYKNMYLYAYI